MVPGHRVADDLELGHIGAVNGQGQGDQGGVAHRVGQQTVQEAFPEALLPAVFRLGIAVPQGPKGLAIGPKKLLYGIQQVVAEPLLLIRTGEGVEKGGCIDAERVAHKIAQIVGTGTGKGVLHVDDLHPVAVDKDIARVEVGVNEGLPVAHIPVAQQVGLRLHRRLLQPGPQVHSLRGGRKGRAVEHAPLLHDPAHTAVGKGLGQLPELLPGQVKF